MNLYRGSQQYVRVPVSADGADPGTSLTVNMAIVAEGTEPDLDTDLIAADWGVTTTSGGNTYRYAQLLAAGSTDAATGAQDITLSPAGTGRYDVYVKVTDFPETPMLHAGVVRVT
jgi:hypothetical protein